MLKAFLQSQGLEMMELKEVGHDLDECMGLCEVMGIGVHMMVTEEEKKRLKIINILYEARELEYISSSVKTFPMLEELQEFGERLFRSLHEPCFAAREQELACDA